LVAGSIAFTINLIQDNAKKELHEIWEFVSRFEPIIKRKWPRYYEEMQGNSLHLDQMLPTNVQANMVYGK
jgi:hypothetical protein